MIEVKSKKRKAVTKNSIISNEQATITTNTTKTICIWGKESSSGNTHLFFVKILVDKPDEPTQKTKELAAFDHQLLHSHVTTMRESKPLPNSYPCSATHVQQHIRKESNSARKPDDHHKCSYGRSIKQI